MDRVRDRQSLHRSKTDFLYPALSIPRERADSARPGASEWTGSLLGGQTIRATLGQLGRHRAWELLGTHTRSWGGGAGESDHQDELG